MYATSKTRSYQVDFDAAVERAYQAFADHYPDWAGYYFDHHFLTHEGAHLLARYRDECIAPDARHLASAWARQMTWFDAGIREARIADLLPAAAHFLCLLRSELPFSGHPSVGRGAPLDCDQWVITASRS